MESNTQNGLYKNNKLNNATKTILTVGIFYFVFQFITTLSFKIEYNFFINLKTEEHFFYCFYIILGCILSPFIISILSVRVLFILCSFTMIADYVVYYSFFYFSNNYENNLVAYKFIQVFEPVVMNLIWISDCSTVTNVSNKNNITTNYSIVFTLSNLGRFLMIFIDRWDPTRLYNDRGIFIGYLVVSSLILIGLLAIPIIKIKSHVHNKEIIEKEQIDIKSSIINAFRDIVKVDLLFIIPSMFAVGFGNAFINYNSVLSNLIPFNYESTVYLIQDDLQVFYLTAVMVFGAISIGISSYYKVNKLIILGFLTILNVIALIIGSIFINSLDKSVDPNNAILDLDYIKISQIVGVFYSLIQIGLNIQIYSIVTGFIIPKSSSLSAVAFITIIIYISFYIARKLFFLNLYFTISIIKHQFISYSILSLVSLILLILYSIYRYPKSSKQSQQLSNIQLSSTTTINKEAQDNII